MLPAGLAALAGWHNVNVEKGMVNTNGMASKYLSDVLITDRAGSNESKDDDFRHNIDSGG